MTSRFELRNGVSVLFDNLFTSKDNTEFSDGVTTIRVRCYGPERKAVSVEIRSTDHHTEHAMIYRKDDGFEIEFESESNYDGLVRDVVIKHFAKFDSSYRS